ERRGGSRPAALRRGRGVDLQRDHRGGLRRRGHRRWRRDRLVHEGGWMTATEIARTLAPLFQARGDEIEDARRLPDDLVESLRDSGLFRLCVPAAYGGLEADVLDFVGAIEELSYADGSSGWCVMIGATT